MSGRGPGLTESIGRNGMEELYERARALKPEARAAFLAEACGGDRRLEAELGSLLAYAEPAEGFFAALAGTVVSPALGHQIGHYRLLASLGSGGMGMVYRAHDTRLNREVALKFLPPHLSAQPEARERLLVEARAAAALDHPNVCSIHEIGEIADGRPFIAMACYEGETLKERLGRGPLPPVEAVSIAIQIARGLGAAHARGIVHRDVKPGNIMVSADGAVRLLDFGLAKLADVTLTGPGVTPGTIAYMSPEQARGDAVDHRTDLWSLGVVLYEMLTGDRPFRGGNDRAVIQAILNQEPEPIRKKQREPPGPLPGIVERLLQKPVGSRYVSAEELLSDLEFPGPRRRIPAFQARRVAMGVAGVLAAVALLYVVRTVHDSTRLPPAANATGATPAIAVLPFTVRGQGLEVWREGIVDLLSMGLDGAGGLRAIDSRTLLARWNEEVGDKTVADLARALGVARRTQARYALVGSAVATGLRIRFAADVYDLESGRSMGQVQEEGPPDSVLSVVDRLGMQTVGVILEKDPGEIPAIDLAGITTSSLIALKAYLEGEARFRRSEYRRASEAWERAVRADTLFALAYFGLAEAYAWDDNGDPDRAREALDRSRRLADRLPSPEKTLVRAQWTGTPEQVLAIQEAVREYPDDAAAWYALGEVYHHQAGMMRGPEEAERAFRRAAELQPASAPYRAHLLDLAFTWRPDSTRVAREVEAYSRLAPQAVRTRAARIALALAFGDTEARARARAALDTLDPESAVLVYMFLAHPRFAAERETVFSAIDPRLDEQFRTTLRHLRYRDVGLTDGRVRHALTVLNDPETPGYVRYCGPLYLSLRGLPVPEGILEERLAVSRADSSSFSNRAWVTCAAAYAAERGRWSEHAALLSHARAVVGRERAAGDSASAQVWDRAVREAEAHGHWRRGRKEEALRAFESVLVGDALGWRALWNVGQLALELGRLDQAERAFRALWQWDGPLAYLYLGRLLERTGRPAEAREAYEFFAYAWRNADPGLQPMVDEARQAVARLSGAEE
ncbi:MAG TPA: protein kinase [Gemmatimonadales bacterium]|nr:protein kinase [Gemmatimonadales bacterium]